VDARPDDDRLDLAVLDAVAGLFARLIAEGEELSAELGIPTFVMKALHMLDAPLAMKQLGSRMRCDPSFITGIADTLEKQGLAARESDPADRRVKRLVLTPAGMELKARMERQMAARMPWRAALSRDERSSLLGLMHKMTPPASATQEACPAEEVSKFLAAPAMSQPPPAAAQPARRRPATPRRDAARAPR
jgi:MarR family transcriptional regulator, organic hydroperoxide resistance regulator